MAKPMIDNRTESIDPRVFTEQHTLYRLFNADGRLLYIGITQNLCGRFRHHQKVQPWWGDVAYCTVQSELNRRTLVGVERLAITRENPLHNKRRDRKKTLREKVAADEWEWIHCQGGHAGGALDAAPTEGDGIVATRPPMTSAERVFLNTGEAQ